MLTANTNSHTDGVPSEAIPSERNCWFYTQRSHMPYAVQTVVRMTGWWRVSPVSFIQFVHILEHLLKQLLWPRARNILLNSSQDVIVLDARKVLLQGDSVNNVRS